MKDLPDLKDLTIHDVQSFGVKQVVTCQLTL